MTSKEEFDIYLQEAAGIISEGMYAEDMNSVVSAAAAKFGLTQKEIVCIKVVIFNLVSTDRRFEDPTHERMRPLVSVGCNTVALLLMKNWDQADIYLGGILDVVSE